MKVLKWDSFQTMKPITIVYACIIAHGLLNTLVTGCPSSCNCGLDTTCDILGKWSNIPSDLPKTAKTMTLECKDGGDLTSLQGLNNYTGLIELTITNCVLDSTGRKLFQDLFKLEKLDLSKNRIKRLFSDSFLGLSVLEELILDNNQIEDIPINTFRDLENLRTLHASYNSIGSLSPGIFDSLVNIRSIFLDENQIVVSSPGVFRSKSLEELNLRNNKLEIISSDFFQGLDSIKNLTLSGNNISSLGTEALQLGTLQRVYLANNKIRSVHFNMFHGHLGYLNLEDNLIQSIDVDFFSKLRGLSVALLGKNPFHCNCEMRWFRNFVVTNKKLLQPTASNTLPKCATPRKAAFTSYKMTQFRCTAPGLAKISGVEGGLSCLSEGDPAPKITWSYADNSTILDYTDPSVVKTEFITQSDLNSTKLSSSGVIMCVVTNRVASNNATIYVQVFRKTIISVSDSDPQKEDKGFSFTIPMVVGIAIAAFAVGLFLMALLFAIPRIKRLSKTAGKTEKGRPAKVNRSSTKLPSRKKDKYRNGNRRDPYTSRHSSVSDYPPPMPGNPRVAIIGKMQKPDDFIRFHDHLRLQHTRTDASSESLYAEPYETLNHTSYRPPSTLVDVVEYAGLPYGENVAIQKGVVDFGEETIQR